MATREDILRKLDISSNDWVLEIGGGPTPFARSDVLADRYVEDDTQRAAPLVIDRPTVVCDAHCLPFLDDSFDYVFCSQILEHLDHPELFFEEIARVGKKGYIETPNEIRERLFGWPFHKWIIEKDENGLIIRQNAVKQEFGLFFHKLQLENYEFARFCSTSHDLLNTCYEWHGMPVYRYAEDDEYCLPDEKVYLSAQEVSAIIAGNSTKRKAFALTDFLKLIKSKMPKTLKQFIRRNILLPPYGIRHSESDTSNYLKEVLACPMCKEKVLFSSSDEIVCAKCSRSFEVERGIPFMLIE